MGSLLLAAGLLSCSSPLASKAGSASIPGQVVLSVTDGRTLAPKSLDLTPASYKAVFSQTAGTPVEVLFQSGEAKSVNLAAGTWSVALEALNQGAAVVGRASASATVESGKTTSVALTLNPVDGKGRLKLTASLEGVVAVNPALLGKLTPADGAAAVDFTFTASGSLQVADLQVDDGSYLLQVTLKDGSSELAVGVETVFIVADAVTEGGLKFNTSGTKPVALISLDIPVNNKVAAPVLSIPGGQVSAGTSVVFASATSGAVFRYTTDGTEPSASSTSASSYTVQGNVTLKVKAFKDGMTASDTTSASYTIPGEVYDGIKIYTASPYTHLHIWEVTVDAGAAAIAPTTWPGKAPSAALGYGDWLAVELPKANKAKAIGNSNGGNQTADLPITAKGSYWIDPVTKAMTNYDPRKPVEPVITATPDPLKKYNATQSITLKGANSDDVIYYTLDGAAPTASSTKYTGPFDIAPKTAVTVLKAFGVNREGVSGAVATFSYDIKTTNDIQAPQVASTPGAGTYPSAQTVSFQISDDKAGVTAWYTTNGTVPTSSGLVLATSAGTSGTSVSLNVTETTRFNVLVRDAAGNETLRSFTFRIGEEPRTDMRQETIYFLMTTRFYDGDSSNNFRGWDDVKAGNLPSDPSWRGDFKGLGQKLDYIKALGFSAIWITPVVKNMSGYDYHGYHAVNHSVVDPRYESADYTYQNLIDDAHAKGMKIIQDVVVNHTGNFGEENLHPLFEKDATGSYKNWLDPTKHEANALLLQGVQALGLSGGYQEQLPGNQFQARIRAMRAPLDADVHYHNHEFKGGWEQYEVQLGSIAGDCQDLNTENPAVAEYMRNAYIGFINMGVDAFRVDTVKHISRLTFNNEFIPQWKAAGGDKFFIFGEVATRYRSIWNDGKPAISTPFYTWNFSNGKSDSTYAWGSRTTNEASAFQHYNDNISTAGQSSSTNHSLLNNTYRTPDWSKRSGMDTIDFPMHWAFNSIADAWSTATGGDWAYSDATFNVTYVDSHDYAPDGAPENQRYTGSWPDKLSLIFTFRGIPTIYYGSEIEFMKGAVIDVGPNKPLAQTGRAYFGDHIEGTVSVSDFGKFSGATGAMATTLNHDLAKHVRALNLIRRAVPALQMGQYSTEGTSGTMTAFKRRYTGETKDGNVDSFALVAVNGGASFSGVPNGTYRDIITGQSHTVTGGNANLTCDGSGNLRVWVLYGGANQPDPGHVLQGLYPLAYIK